MKKHTRQRIILDIIKEHEVETQEELAEYLLDRKIDITQATISRDIKELRLVKVLTPNGKYKYATMDSQYEGVDGRLNNIFNSTVLSVEKTESMIVLKTLPGAAKLCAIIIDGLNIEGVAGTIAGDDTLFVAINKKGMIDSVLSDIKDLLK